MRTISSGNHVGCGRRFEPCFGFDLENLGTRLRRLEAGNARPSAFEQECQELIDHVTSELAVASLEQKAVREQPSARVYACMDLLENLKAFQMLPPAS
jgi:hypothetical protein